jgi:hypothetical protein
MVAFTDKLETMDILSKTSHPFTSDKLLLALDIFTVTV